MSEHRRLMDRALKEHFAPGLRERGFKGSGLHFRRRLEDRIDYLMVQFRQAGGSFTVEVGQSGPNGLEDPNWPDLTVEKTTVAHLRHRKRVTRGSPRDQWLTFGPRDYDPREPVKPQAFYDDLARTALRAFETEGEAWLRRLPALGGEGGRNAATRQSLSARNEGAEPMADNHNDGGAPPAAAPAGATRLMVIILAALVVVALLAWFLLGTPRAPGPAATENAKTETEQSFEDTVIVNPDGTTAQQVTPNDTLTPQGEVINAPPITDAPANTTP